MHFSKTYSQLLLSLPPELRQNAIQYRQLKKLINQVVNELTSLGLDPSILPSLLASAQTESLTEGQAECLPLPLGLSRIVYELHGEDSEHIEPRLKVWTHRSSSDVSIPPAASISEVETGSSTSLGTSELDEQEDGEGLNLLYHLQSGQFEGVDNFVDGSPLAQASTSASVSPGKINEVGQIDTTAHPASISSESSGEVITIPLLSDAAFFQLLSTTIKSLTNHMQIMHSEFVDSLQGLSKEIAQTARPASEASSSSNASTAALTHISKFRNKSDLESWRSIFQVYIDAEVFEGISETSRGEHSIEESERRLRHFAEEVTKRGHSNKLKLKQSKVALEKFIAVNLFILNVKKFQYGNTEATRKILKKHAKRTALPYPPPSLVLSDSSLTSNTSPPSADLSLIPILPTPPLASLARTLVQAVGETLLPVVPHIDDYSCLICLNLAFKPIRLQCGHLFCVRCLVKMQKRGQDHCPMCRAPTVLIANRSNVDWAMLNFMEDWFPAESRKKKKQNEKESADEELREMGLDPDHACVIA